MKIVVIGGSGLIGKKLVHKLRELGHQVAISWPQKRPLVWDITLHCRLSAPTVFPRMGTTERRWPKKT